MDWRGQVKSQESWDDPAEQIAFVLIQDSIGGSRIASPQYFNITPENL